MNIIVSAVDALNAHLLQNFALISAKLVHITLMELVHLEISDCQQ